MVWPAAAKAELHVSMPRSGDRRLKRNGQRDLAALSAVQVLWCDQFFRVLPWIEAAQQLDENNSKS